MSPLDGDTIRDLEHRSIRRFVESYPFEGRVLDYGCGKQPYREFVESRGAEYHGFDRVDFAANVSGEDVGDEPLRVDGSLNLVGNGEWDAILCTQVIEYVDVQRVDHWLIGLRDLLKPGGALVLSGPTNWAEVEPQDLTRYTLAGIRWLLQATGFTIDRLEQRASVMLPGFELSLGWGAVARPTAEVRSLAE